MIKIVSAGLLVAALLTGASGDAVRADDTTTPDHQSVGFFAEHTGGTLVSCNITFNAVTRDYVYAAGRPVTLNGSFGIMAMQGKVFLVSKFVPSDPHLTMSGGIDLTTFTPPLAYFVLNGSSTIGQDFKTFTCDAGGICAAYRIDHLVQPFMTSFQPGGGFDVAYARVAGGLDVTTHIKLPDPRRREADGEAMLKYEQCVMDLMQSAKSR